MIVECELIHHKDNIYRQISFQVTGASPDGEAVTQQAAIDIESLDLIKQNTMSFVAL